MGKKLLVVLLIFLILIGAGGYLGYTLYDSATKINARTENFTATSDIEKNIVNLQPQFSGVVVIQGDLIIENGGKIVLKDIVIHIELYFKAEGTSSYVQIGEGDINYGTVDAESTVSRTIKINATEYIAELAVSDGTIRVDYVVTVTPTYLGVGKTIDLPGSTDVPWTAPYKQAM